MHKRRRKIKWLSIAFGVGATAIFAVSAFFLISNKKEMLQKIALKQIGNSFSNIDFKTYDRLGKEISIISDNVCVDQEGNYIFKNLVSTFTLANGEPLTISAVTTKALREDKTECEFIGNVKLSTESGLLLESEKLFVDSNKKIAKGDTSVVISQQDTQLSAQKYFYDVNSNTFTLSENAQGTLKTDKVSANQLIIRFDDAHGKKMGSMDALGNVKFSTESGLLLESETLFVDCNQKIARGDTSVVISQEDTQLSGQRYFYDANSNIFTLNENAKGTFKTDKISANQLIIRFDDAHGKKVKSMDALGDATYVTQYYTLKAKQNILYTEKEMKARENVSLLYKKDVDNYDIRADFMQAEINNGELGTVKANGSLIIKTKDATIHADRGVLVGNEAHVFGNVTISNERGNVFGNAATMDMKTGDVLVNQLSGIVTDEKNK